MFPCAFLKKLNAVVGGGRTEQANFSVSVQKHGHQEKSVYFNTGMRRSATCGAGNSDAVHVAGTEL